MAHKTRVAVYGSCVYMTSLALGLQANPALDVVHISRISPAFSQGLAEFEPAVIAFDAGDAPEDLARSVLQDRPDLLLISVEQATDEMLLLPSGQRATVRTANDFLELINSRENRSGEQQIVETP